MYDKYFFEVLVFCKVFHKLLGENFVNITRGTFATTN